MKNLIHPKQSDCFNLILAINWDEFIALLFAASRWCLQISQAYSWFGKQLMEPTQHFKQLISNNVLLPPSLVIEIMSLLLSEFLATLGFSKQHFVHICLLNTLKVASTVLSISRKKTHQ